MLVVFVLQKKKLRYQSFLRIVLKKLLFIKMRSIK